MKTVRTLPLPWAYSPRHAAPAYSPRHAAPARPLAGRLRALWGRLRALWACIDEAMDREMSGPGLMLCGVILGLFVWPTVIYCYFFG